MAEQLSAGNIYEINGKITFVKLFTLLQEIRTTGHKYMMVTNNSNRKHRKTTLSWRTVRTWNILSHGVILMNSTVAVKRLERTEGGVKAWDWLVGGSGVEHKMWHRIHEKMGEGLGLLVPQTCSDSQSDQGFSARGRNSSSSLIPQSSQFLDPSKNNLPPKNVFSNVASTTLQGREIQRFTPF